MAPWLGAAAAPGKNSPKAREYTTAHPLVYEDVYDLPPYTFLNGDGEPVGFNIDLVKIIMRKLDIPYIIKLKNTTEVYNDLKNGKSDLMLGFRTQYHSQFGKYGRSIAALFTYSIAHPENENPDIKELSDIRRFKVSVQNGSLTHRTALEKNLGEFVIPHDDIYDIIQQTAARDSGMILWNTMSLNYIIKQHNLENLAITPVNMHNGEYRFMSQDEELLRRVDSVFEKLMINEELQPIRNKWFYPDVRPTGISSKVWYIVGGLSVMILLMIVYNRIYHLQIRRINKTNDNQRQRLELYLKTGKINMWTYDTKRNIFCTYRTDGEMLEEYTRFGFSIFFNDEDYKRLCAEIDTVANRTKKAAGILIRCHKPTTPNEEHYFDVKISVLYSKGGNPVTLLGTQQNVTEEKKKHIETRNLILRYDTVFNTVTEDMAYFDSDGILTDINDKACETLGIKDKKALLDMHISINDMPPYTDFDVNNPEGCHSSIIIKEHRKTCTDSGRYIPAIPEDIKYYEHMVLPFFREDNSLHGILTIGRDITRTARDIQAEHRKRQHIIANTAKLHEYVGNISYALETSQIWLINYYPETKTFELTHNLKETALKLSQLRGVIMIAESERRKAVKLIRRMDKGVNRQLNVTLKTRLKDKSGNNIYMQLDFIPITDKDGRTSQYFGLCRDVSSLMETERLLTQEAEKAREAEIVKTAFMKNISYEIRTPLYSVMGFAEMFNQKHSKGDENVFLDEIRKNSSMLLNLINDILFLSRLDANMVEFNIAPTDFASTFAPYCMVGWSRGLKDGVKTVLEEPYEELIVNIDSTRVGYVLETLTYSSTIFTTSGMMRGRYEYHHDSLEISIEDTGVGIDKETLRSMFTNINISENTQECSIRLKLQICKRLVERMGGSMEIESELGKGTTIWIRIPCEATTIKKKNILI